MITVDGGNSGASTYGAIQTEHNTLDYNAYDLSTSMVAGCSQLISTFHGSHVTTMCFVQGSDLIVFYCY